MKCLTHEWDWDISDPTGCPICHGAELERERILAELEALTSRLAAMETGYGPKSGNMAIRVKTLEYAITLIKGENK
jgi:hypothetical protein